MFAKHKQLGLQRNLSLFWGKKAEGDEFTVSLLLLV